MKKVCLFLSDDVFAGLMIRPLLNNQPQIIAGIYIEQEMVGQRLPLETFLYVTQKSGIRYALYQAVELICYRLLALIWELYSKRSILPSSQAKRLKIPLFFINKQTWPILVEQLKSERPDLILCIRFSRILKQDMLGIPLNGIVNFHGSLLPKYAGLGSVLQAVRHGERFTGGTFHTMTENVDEGVIVRQIQVPIDPDESVSSLHTKIYFASSQEILKIFDPVSEQTETKQIITRQSYYSFPAAEHVSEVITHGRKLIRPRDLVNFWKSL
ncbi:MAG: formyltransferase family protein [Sporomusaceae bacterium]|nr:formyltransferase family protein [Sporomusaceae bacterium]